MKRVNCIETAPTSGNLRKRPALNRCAMLRTIKLLQLLTGQTRANVRQLKQGAAKLTRQVVRSPSKIYLQHRSWCRMFANEIQPKWVFHISLGLCASDPQ